MSQKRWVTTCKVRIDGGLYLAGEDVSDLKPSRLEELEGRYVRRTDGETKTSDSGSSGSKVVAKKKRGRPRKSSKPVGDVSSDETPSDDTPDGGDSEDDSSTENESTEE